MSMAAEPKKRSKRELRVAWQQWSDEGGALMTEEYNQAYHAAQE